MSRERVWRVPEGAPDALGRVLERMEVDAESALAAGRVFVDGVRAVDASTAVVPGGVVCVFDARPVVGEAFVVDRAQGFVAAFKPPELPTEPDRAGSDSLTRRLAQALGVPALHAESRLDVGVSGIVLLSESAGARQWAASLRERHALSREYLGVCARPPEPERGRWQGRVDGKPAESRYHRLARAAPATAPRGEPLTPALVLLCPDTGRKHQLRVHAAAAGAPLLGDRRYGGPTRIVRGTGDVVEIPRPLLHAFRIELSLPDGTSWCPAAPVPDDFVSVWVALGGARQDLTVSSPARPGT
ncbi:MAG: RNA pseudouridine synthase [Polyangiaceae bacterium]